RRDLDRPIRAFERRPAGDGARRRGRAQAARRPGGRLGRARVVLSGAGRSARTSPLHPARRVPRLEGARCSAFGRPWKSRCVAKRARALRGPLYRLTRGLPRSWHIALDWLITINGALIIVIGVKHWIINPYRIPTASMEPTLHCAPRDPKGTGCLA